MIANPRLDAALAYAARGWSVFPCQEGKKVPATKNGWLDSTTDQNTIKSWWQENPNYNVAIATGPSNLCVIDIDPGGLDGWDEIVQQLPDLARLENEFPRVDTPRGGFHYYMEGEGFTTASKLAKGVDTRGKGGYVLAPPSYVDDGKSKGAYEGEPHIGDIPPVYTPIFSRIGKEPKTTAPEPAVPPEQVKWDEPETLRRAEAVLTTFVNEGKVAVEGAGGDQTTYEVACKVLELGITPDTAHRLLADIWNPHCEPPWADAELLDKVRNAWKYGQETKGGKAQPPVAEQFAHLLPQVEETDDPRGPEPNLDTRYKPNQLSKARVNLPPLEWLVDGIIPKQGIGMLFGAPESYKTFITLDLALSIATGLGVNWWPERREPADVLYMAAEGTHALKGKRVDSWLSKNLIPGLDQNLDRFHLIDSVIPYEYGSEWRNLVAWLRYYDIAPKLLVVDTHSRAMLGWDESSPGDTAKATHRMEEFAKEFGCFVLAIHHTGKDENRGARGSSALLGNMDVMYEAEKLGGDSMDTLFHVRKLKDGEKPGYPFMFRGKPYGESLSFHRDWEWRPEKKNESLPKEEALPQYTEPANIAKALADGPMIQSHLSQTLAEWFGVSPHTVGVALTKAKQTRLKAWFIDGVWKLPEGFEMPKEDEF